MVLGLTRPILTSAALGGGKIAVIIDGSASMQTRYERGETRYGEAIAQAESYLKRTRPGQLTLIQAQSQSRLLAPMTVQIDEALKQLKTSSPTLQGDASDRDLIEVLRSQADLREYREIAIFTDRLFTEPIWKSLPTRLISLGKPAPNVSVTGFAVRLEPDRSLGYSLWTELTSFSDKESNVRLTVRADGEPIETVTLLLKPNERRGHSFSFTDVKKTLYEAEVQMLGDPDSFPWDNKRYFVLAERPALNVLWIGDENVFLERALLANARLRIAKKTEYTPSDDLSQIDLIVANNAQLPTVSQGRWLMVNSSSSEIVDANASEAAQHLRVTQSDHPLLRLIEPSHIRFAKMQRVVLPRHGKSVLSAGDNPVLYVIEEPEFKSVGLSFGLQESNLVLTVDFPILIRNALGWLLPQIEPTMPKQVGQALTLANRSGDAQEVLGPRGRILLSQGENLVQTTEPGFYRVQAADGLRAWAVNLTPEESEKGVEALVEPAALSTQSQVQVQSQLPLWRYLLAVALLILIWELFVYDRTLFRPTGGESV
jgi:hypothetical protein